MSIKNFKKCYKRNYSAFAFGNSTVNKLLFCNNKLLLWKQYYSISELPRTKVELFHF